MGLGVDGCILLVPASLTQPSLEQKMGFGGRVVSPEWQRGRAGCGCPGWQCRDAPGKGTGMSWGTAAPGRGTLRSSGTGNSAGTAGPALGWESFDLGSAQADPTQPNTSVFQECQVCTVCACQPKLGKVVCSWWDLLQILSQIVLQSEEYLNLWMLRQKLISPAKNLVFSIDSARWECCNSKRTVGS